MQEGKLILFVCVGNSGRSQIAEALFNSRAPRGYYAMSAGTNPAEEVNPLVVQALKERGIDISKAKPKAVERWMYEKAERAILMGCSDESCPIIFLKKVEDWNIEDIRGMPIEEIRRVLGQIEEKVDALIHELGP
ncbi:MAG: arsenate-mycothiol transferase ArsC [Nitrososphaeria archaeon]